jgi:hypothetical protein
MSFHRVVVATTVALCILSTSQPANTQSRFVAADLRRLAPARNAPLPLPLPDFAKLNELQKAYLDSYSILSQENSCSQFFGGTKSISALNDLIAQLRPSHLDKQIGIRMAGEITIVRNAETGLRYRLFKKAEINLDGPFYLSNNLPNRRSIPNIGEFAPSTREARVAVLLHELGHLVRTENGDYVLPNDGTDFGLSSDNTYRIIAACGGQIRELHHISFEEELIATRMPPGGAANAGTQ